jgi:hypothetical protein
MKKILVLCATALVLSAPSAFAGLDLTWGACASNGGTTDVVLDCANGSALAIMYAQVAHTDAIAGFLSMDAVVDIQVDAVTLTPFWDLNDPVVNPSGCNPGWVFGDERPSTGCASASALLWGQFPAGGQGTASGAYKPGVGGPNRGRVIGGVFRSSTSPINFAANTNYFAFHIDIFSALAGEAGGPCPGCSTPMQIVFNQAGLGFLAAQNSTESGTINVIGPGVLSNQSTTFGGGDIPDGATPTQSKSWGALKSLYR